jgi:hypothetical protein
MLLDNDLTLMNTFPPGTDLKDKHGCSPLLAFAFIGGYGDYIEQLGATSACVLLSEEISNRFMDRVKMSFAERLEYQRAETKRLAKIRLGVYPSPDCS